MTLYRLFLIAAVSLLSLTCVMSRAAIVVDVSKAGVVGDGITLNTVAIQKLIDDTSLAGGGVIEFSAGRYLTGTIQLKSGVTLQLDDQATLLGSTDIADYRNVDPFLDGGGNPMGHALIVAVDADKVGIIGNGTVDGQGLRLSAKQHPYLIRPFLVRWVRCTNVTVQDVHLANPGAWTLNFFQTKGAVIQNVTIRSRDQRLRNNDGINIDSCEDFKISDCDVVSGDDALVIKTTSHQASQNINVTNCMLSTRTNAIKLGTESIGDFDNITVSHCSVTNTGMAGIALYTVDGGSIRHIEIDHITMDGVAAPISIRLGARLKTFREGELPNQKPGALSDVTISNISAKNIQLIGILINGVPGYPVQSLDLNNIQIDIPGGGTAADAAVQLPEKEEAYPEFGMFGKTMPAYGVYARHVADLKLQNVKFTLLTPDARPESDFVDTSDVTPSNFGLQTGSN